MEIHSDFGTLVEPERRDVATNKDNHDSFKQYLERETVSEPEFTEIEEYVSDDIYISLLEQDFSKTLDEKNIDVNVEIATLLNQAFIQSAFATGQYKTISSSEFDSGTFSPNLVGTNTQTAGVKDGNITWVKNASAMSSNSIHRSFTAGVHINTERNVENASINRSETHRQQVLLPYRPIDDYAKVFIKVVEHGKNLKIMYRNFEDVEGVSLKQQLFNSDSSLPHVPLSLTINGKTEVFNGYPASR
ncbi:hypothetical protein [Enterovibrio baiacu]|uniref:hypothetical protein n=1 Tax=Enterovibrio baiacu TaxID=2491023 RepID=UPI001011F28E|nr:hypothetical protein [Enterovibrio baiacu]MBE1277709.1 hypothetical protein [Enterovibrio baiacu]